MTFIEPYVLFMKLLKGWSRGKGTISLLEFQQKKKYSYFTATPRAAPLNYNFKIQ